MLLTVTSYRKETERKEKFIHPRTYLAIHQWRRTTATNGGFGNASIGMCFGVLKWSYMYIDTVHSSCRITITLRCGFRWWSHIDTVYTNYIPLDREHVSITAILTWSYIDAVDIAVVTSIITACCGVLVRTGILSHKQQCPCSRCLHIRCLTSPSYTTSLNSPSPHSMGQPCTV